jgi:hypothetical protein
MQKFKKGYEYECRNNQEIRNLLTDVITILTFSNKFVNKLPKINDKNLAKEDKKYKIASNNFNIIHNIINGEDDKDLIIAANEIMYQLKNGKLEDAIYWYLWIDKLDKFKKKNKINFYAKKRNVKLINDKYQSDWIWLIWEIIFLCCNNNKICNQLNALQNIYILKYSSSAKNKKQYIIYQAFGLVKENINWNIPLINNYEYRIQAICNINQLYKSKIINMNTEIEYEKINNIVNDSGIIIKTEKNTKPIKIKNIVKDTEKKEALMMQKLEHFGKLVFYKLDPKLYEHDIKHDKMEYKNITYSI